MKCRLCDKRSFRSVDIQKHCHIVHRDEESEWFELVPALEGDIVEVTKETHEANIALVKKEINPKDDAMMMMMMRTCPNWFQCVDSLVLFLCISQSLYRLFLAPIYCWFPYKGASLKWAEHLKFLDLPDNSVGAEDLRDFMNYFKDSPVPQSHHAQD